MNTNQAVADALASAELVVSGICVGWTGSKDESVQHSYHTFPDGIVVRLFWAQTPTSSQLAQADSIVQAVPLNQAKADKTVAIDAQTTRLLAAGFAYTPQAAGSVRGMFGLDPTSVANWTGLKNLAELAAKNNASFPYPCQIATVDGSLASLASLDDIEAFYLAGGVRSMTIQQGGVALKVKVRNAADQTTLDAIVDNRT